MKSSPIKNGEKTTTGEEVTTTAEGERITSEGTREEEEEVKKLENEAPDTWHWQDSVIKKGHYL